MNGIQRLSISCQLSSAVRCLQMPCCIGAVLRRRLAVAIGARPPPFAAACLKNHCLLAPCSICQEAKIVQKKQHGLDHKAAVVRIER